jgi:hypothetical protein
MIINYDSKDIFLTEDFDIIVSKKTDKVRNATYEDNELLEQTITRRIQTNANDFEIEKILCANLNDELGSKIDNSLVNRIQSRIIETLTIDGFLESENLSISVVMQNNVNAIVTINVYNNRINRDEIFAYGFSYNLDNNLTVQNF